MTRAPAPKRLKALHPFDAVYHRKYGFGTVLTRARAGRLFASLGLGHYGEFLCEALQPAAEVLAGSGGPHWWRRVFRLERAGTRHDMGRRWGLFESGRPDDVALLQRLKGWRQQDAVMPAAPRRLPARWPVLRAQEFGGLCGMTFVRGVDALRNVGGVFPSFGVGSEHSVAIRRVWSWAGRSAAQIEGQIGDVTVTFFDTRYWVNAGWYAQGSCHRFVLIGLADQCSIRRGGEASRCSFARKPRGDRDDYRFAGTVTRVRVLRWAWDESTIWQVRVAVTEGTTSERLELDVALTSKVLAGAEPPAPGDHLSGTLWLQGFLWRPDASPLSAANNKNINKNK